MASGTGEGEGKEKDSKSIKREWTEKDETAFINGREAS